MQYTDKWQRAIARLLDDQCSYMDYWWEAANSVSIEIYGKGGQATRCRRTILGYSVMRRPLLEYDRERSKK